MNDQMNPEDGPHAAHRTVFRSRWVLIGFLLVIAYFLFTEHRAHVIPFLPFLLLATCLLYTSPSPRDATLSRMPSSA